MINRIKKFLIGIVIICLVSLNIIYMAGVDTRYAVRFNELVQFGNISDFDRYFNRFTKIYYENEFIYYYEARQNIIKYIDENERINCNSYGFSYDYLPMIQEGHIRYTTNREYVLYFKYLKLFFSIEILSFTIDDECEDLYEIFFGE